jgi:hypothetical protein
MKNDSLPDLFVVRKRHPEHTLDVSSVKDVIEDL